MFFKDLEKLLAKNYSTNLFIFLSSSLGIEKIDLNTSPTSIWHHVIQVKTYKYQASLKNDLNNENIKIKYKNIFN